MPVIIGYEIQHHQNGTVAFRTGENALVPDSDYEEIVHSIEEFHGLKYNKRIRIFFLKEFFEIKRFIPWFNIQGVSGCSLQTGDVVFIIVSAIKRKNQLIEEIIKHELSHCILYQNMNFFDTFKLKSWFIEGLAVYSGGPKNYPEDEFQKIYEHNTYFYNYDFNDLYANLPESNPRYRFALYGKFIEHIFLSHGIKKLQDFIKAYIQNPQNVRQEFKEIYHMELIDVLKIFENDIKEKYK